VNHLVQPNVQRIKLREPLSTPSGEQESYVHVKPTLSVLPLEPSFFLRYWKPACIVALSISCCVAIVRGPLSNSKGKGSLEVSLASLAELQEEAINVEELDLGNGDYTPVIYSGSEFQARMEQPRSTAPVVVSSESDAQAAQVQAALDAARIRAAGRKDEPRQHEDLRSMVKFISGLIAVHRPNITDCGKVAAQIVKHSARAKVDPFLVAAMISVESRFGQSERSSVGAVGLMQLMPATARHVADPKQAIRPSLTDVATNIQLGVDYWNELSKRYRGNTFVALAAYNWGPGNVDKVSRNPQRFPGSVAKYARTIMERHRNWANHFKNAKAGASELG